MKYSFVIVIIISLCLGLKKDDIVSDADTIQYPEGYPNPSKTVIQQLQSYPLPRYFKSNKLQHLFNWMDPTYMGGRGTTGINDNVATINGTIIQEELITNWHYGIVLHNVRTSLSGPKENGSPLYINLANKHPEVPLHVTTFWQQLSPKQAGYAYKKPTIITKNLDSSLYINFDFYGKPKREINFTFPDSFIQIDGHTQKYYLNNALKYLTRPIDVINENGEEPPGPYLLDEIQEDPVMIHLKKILKNETWEEFMAERKLHLRKVYADCFMKEIPELKNTKFNFYAVEGGPINCFEWHVMKKITSPTNGAYYSTPDFYPRWPKNWKDWDGPWHGWKWIETGRTKEIKDGDYLFSPFIAAGWSKKQEEDIRPGQWLGLLKCLSGIGAEFYYTGYFSLSKPFTDPAKWVWQAAMPAYAQAITSRFEDVLKGGNVLFDEEKNPIITYNTNDKHVLVTIRKHNQKEKYIICGTYQPFSNEANDIPEKKNVTISFANQELTFEVRRQGSVYVYEKTPEGKILFYQLDRWHENAHPDHWTKDFHFEAEVADTTISNNHLFTINKNGGTDYSDFTSYISMNKSVSSVYQFTQRDSINSVKYVWLRYKGEGSFFFSLKKENVKSIQQEEKMLKSEKWKWHKIKLTGNTFSKRKMSLIIQCNKGTLDLDKLIISSSETTPTL
jgi:hypothetical protein